MVLLVTCLCTTGPLIFLFFRCFARFIRVHVPGTRVHVFHCTPVVLPVLFSTTVALTSLGAECIAVLCCCSSLHSRKKMTQRHCCCLHQIQYGSNIVMSHGYIHKRSTQDTKRFKLVREVASSRLSYSTGWYIHSCKTIYTLCTVHM